MDTRVLHCGGATALERAHALLTFRRRETGRAAAQLPARGPARSVFLEDVVECVSRAERAANPTATDRVRMAAIGRTQ